MRLSQKDKEFLERLKDLLDSDDLWIERTLGRPSRFILKGNYGARIEQKFGLTRQGVRWRFQRLFNELYVDSFCVLVFIERTLGPAFRQEALIIASERFDERQRALRDLAFKEANAYRGKNKD